MTQLTSERIKIEPVRDAGSQVLHSSHMASHHRAQPCISAEVTKLLGLFSSPTEQKLELSTRS